MRQRVITALIIVAIFIPVAITGSWLLDSVVLLLAGVGLYEFYKMKGKTILSLEGVISSLSLVFIILPDLAKIFLPSRITSGMLIYLLAIILLLYTVLSKNTFTFDDASFSVLSVVYLGFGFRSLLLAREAGLELLILVLITIWTTDICAYLFGRKIGRHKLAPSISPNKTIEGFVSGTLMAVIVTGIYLYFSTLQMPFFSTLFILFVASIAGQFGDLIESAFKRHYTVKDSGSIFPGHGGVLDRFDSLLIVFPIFYFTGLI